MSKMKIEYHCPYTSGEVCGYVMADQSYDGKRYITRKQYERACDKLPIGGDIGPIFHNPVPLLVTSGHGKPRFIIDTWRGAMK